MQCTESDVTGSAKASGCLKALGSRPPADNRAQRGAVVSPSTECWYLSSPDTGTWITRQPEMHCKFQWQEPKIWVFCMAKPPYSNNRHWLWYEHYLVSSLRAVISPTFQRCRLKKTDSRWAWGQAIWFSVQGCNLFKSSSRVDDWQFCQRQVLDRSQRTVCVFMGKLITINSGGKNKAIGAQSNHWAVWWQKMITGPGLTISGPFALKSLGAFSILKDSSWGQHQEPESAVKKSLPFWFIVQLKRQGS